MRAYDEGSAFKIQVQYRGSPWGGLETSTQTVFSFGFFFLRGMCPCGSVPPPSLEWLPLLPRAATVLITPKGAESPGNGRIGVISALVFFFPSEAVQDKLHSPWPAQ